MVVTIEKEGLFRQNQNVHIHRSDELSDYVGVLHRHRFIEVVYILSGRARHIIEDNEYAVQKGDIAVINTNEVHAFMADPDDDEPFLAYHLMFTPDFLDANGLAGEDFSLLSDAFLFYSLFPEEQDFKKRFNLIPRQYELGAVFEKIYSEYQNQKIGYVNLIRIYTAEIMIRLLRRIQQRDETQLSPAQKGLVENVIAYIEENYNIKIKTEEIASRLFFNKNYISRLFKQETGLSIHEFVREIRIKEACRQLSSTRRTVSDIAADCGFSDMKTFYAVFKKHTGYTPKAYRDNHAK
jgi:AraC-like DNA-binding protein